MTSRSGYKIEKGFKMPQRSGALPLYPFEDMAVGDSFFAPCERHKLSPAAVRAQKATGWTFTIRKVEGGHRIWRVA